EHAGEESIDARRFRMLVEIDGVEPHAEDEWVGRRVRVGSALVAMHGNVGRCLVTSRDPQSGTIDLPTLDLLGSYRGHVESTGPPPVNPTRIGPPPVNPTRTGPPAGRLDSDGPPPGHRCQPYGR